MRQPHEIHCTQCGRSYVVHVEPADIAKWRAGELIQRAMPYLTPDEREILMSGVCGACFDRMFKEKEGLD